MNNKEIKEKIKSLKKLYDEKKFDDAHAESESFVLELFKEKKYKDIVEADKKLESVPIIFEVAYSYSETEMRIKPKKYMKRFFLLKGKEIARENQKEK